MKRQFILLTVVATTLLAAPITWHLTGAEPPVISPATRSFMQGKLQHSQKILEGLALENFDLIAKNAQELSLLSLESQWEVIRTQHYVDQSADFRHAIQHLVDAAKSKNVDAVALAYMDVTLKCVHCHKYVRDRSAREGISQLILPDLQREIALRR